MINFDRPIAYHREFVQFGGVKAAVFLSQAFYWHYRTKDTEGWFYKTRDEWEEETGLTRKEQESARKSLKEYGILHEKSEGLPRRLFYQIDVVKLEELLADLYGQKLPSSRSESYQLEGPELPGFIKDTETTTETTTETKKINKKEIEFELFWKNYPRKINKKKAKSVYLRAKGLPPIEKHIKILSRWAATKQWREGFIPHPTTWLNGERWEDHLPVEPYDWSSFEGEDKHLLHCWTMENHRDPLSNNEAMKILEEIRK